MSGPTEAEKRQFHLLTLFSLIFTGAIFLLVHDPVDPREIFPPGRVVVKLNDRGSPSAWVDPVLERGAADVGKVRLNSSPREDLLVCPGIGPAFAEKILKEREKGRFVDWHDLKARVSGLGDARLQTLREQGVTLGD